MNITNNRAALEASGVVIREGHDLVAKWMELTNMTIPVVHYPYGPCSKPETWQVPIFLDAMQRARKAFIEAGALAPCDIQEDDCRVYEFPRQGQVLFVFYRTIAGEAKEFSRKYDLPPQAIAFLKVTGRWAEVTSH